jgi:hypothetical protein
MFRRQCDLGPGLRRDDVAFALREAKHLQEGITAPLVPTPSADLRYADETGARSHLYVVNIIHGARDLEAYFAVHPDDDGA